MTKKQVNLEAGWNFDNSYSRLPKTFFKEQHPTPVSSPKLAVINEAFAKSIGLNLEALKGEDGSALFAGNVIPEGASPLAQAYGGHQFGHFNMLGDGRAILLGEHITPEGERLDIVLKGPGRTPYSRGGDGRAALGPMLREYIISEAMHALRIPTTRSLAVVTTGEPVYREKVLPGAILTRVAASHLRVGTFQYAARWGNVEDLRVLADYAIERHYPEIETGDGSYLKLLQAVIKRQAELITKWQLVGFIHGVMNTDNMTISGESIDYGPCAFMDKYDSATVFSSIDRNGRYAYGNQPYIAGWNLARFAETLIPLLHEDSELAVSMAQAEISKYPDIYQSYWLAGMRSKLGIFNEESQDEALIEELLGLMQKNGADFTKTFTALTFGKTQDTELFGTTEFMQWHEKWKDRLTRQQQSTEAVQELMRNSNPAVIPRNHRVEAALEAAVEKGDYSVMEELLSMLENPFAHTPAQVDYSSLPDQLDGPYRTYCGT